MATEVKDDLLPCPEPGVYYDFEASVYHSWDAVSNSKLGELDKSPAHLRHYLDHGREATPDLEFGTAVHTAILEPSTLAERYAIGGPINPRTGKCYGRESDKYAAWLDEQGKPGMTDEDAEACRAISDACRAHPMVSKLLNLDGRSEVSVVWDDAETGIRCRGRIDLLLEGNGCIVDLKTTKDASADSFSRSIFNWGYARQSAMYTDACAAHGIEITEYIVVAIEKGPPYAIAAYLLKQDAVEWGRAQYRRLLALYAECQRSGEWPGYGDGKFIEIGLPQWAMKQEQVVPY